MCCVEQTQTQAHSQREAERKTNECIVNQLKKAQRYVPNIKCDFDQFQRRTEQMKLYTAEQRRKKGNPTSNTV